MKAKPLFGEVVFKVAVRIQSREKVVAKISQLGEVITVKTFESNGYAETKIKFKTDIYRAVDIADYINKVEQAVIDSGNNSWDNYKINP